MSENKGTEATEVYQAALTAGDEALAVETYRAASSGDKARMRAIVGEVAKQAVLAGDLTGAQFALAVQEAQSVKVTEPTKIDWTERWATRLATLDLAADLVRVGTVGDLPEGVEIDWPAVQARAAELATDDAVKVAAAKIAEQSIGRGQVAEGGDIAAHVTQALEALGEGFHKVSEIRNQPTEEYPGDQRPSAGAISARLFPKEGACTIEGVVPMPATKDRVAGARLA